MARLAIRMPKMSMTMTEGEVSSWLVEVGAEVVEGDVLCEVMTDKVDMEVESTVSGTLVEIAVASGMADVGAPIGWVEGEDTGGSFGDLLTEPQPEPQPEPQTEPEPGPDPDTEAAAPSGPDRVDAIPSTPVPPEGPPAPAAPAVPDVPDVPAVPAVPAVPDVPDVPTPERSGPVPAVPRARALAAEHGIDLATVTGTGPDGLVRMADVEARVEPEPAASTPAPTPPPAPEAAVRAAAPPPTATKDGARKAAIRRAVARAMTPTAAVPQFTVWRTIELDAADAGRRGLSWTTVLLRAYAGALREVPDLLCRWEDDGPTPAGPPAVALAVATDRGLLVPIFTEPDKGPARELDEELRAVVRAAHTGKLDQAYLGVANASLSNLGGMGVDRFQALVTPPQATVLSLGSIRQRPVAVPGGVGLALTVEAGLTVDHRVGDGAHGAEVLERLAALLGASL